jgi:hypothetical protein
MVRLDGDLFGSSICHLPHCPPVRVSRVFQKPEWLNAGANVQTPLASQSDDALDVRTLVLVFLFH